MNTNQFSLANRKHLADMLDESYDGLRSKAKRQYSNREAAIHQKLVDEQAEKRGAVVIVTQIKATNKKLQEFEKELETLGFNWDGSDFGLYSKSAAPVRKLIHDQIVKELGTIADIDARFDSAQIAMMTVASLEDADKLLRSVSAI